MTNITPQILNMMMVILIFFIGSCLVKGNLQIIQKLYIITSGCLLIWIAAVSAIQNLADSETELLEAFDAVTCAASAFLVMTIFVTTYSYVNNLIEMNKKCRLLYLLPIVTSLIVFTNPVHHLFYENFSIYASEVRFGPLFFISGVQYYLWSMASIILMIQYGRNNRHRMIMTQVILYVIGLLVPLAVNFLATFMKGSLTIAATPMAFFVTIVCHGYSIYFLNFMNIKPIALQNIMDNIADGYVIFSTDSCVINYNRSFQNYFAKDYQIRINGYLNVIVDELEDRKKDVIYNLLNFLDVCKRSTSSISYEQAILKEEGKFYYSVELTPVFVRGKMAGVVALFSDMTKIKEEMRREKENLSRAMERERLASLGQLIGSISHNLKTPIMSVSGSAESLDNLVTEYRDSIDDPEVTSADHREIAADMEKWLGKIRSSCAYMSDIITTAKGMAANLNASEVAEFSMEDVCKKIKILMKHNLMKQNCQLVIKNELSEHTILKGDVNNMVQVVMNLIDNAKDAMAASGGDIVLHTWNQEDSLMISVADTGTGIPDEVKNKLFVSMYTSKGAKGTGLGLYSSAGLIRGKFNGHMWVEDNAEKGSIFYIQIPLCI